MENHDFGVACVENKEKSEQILLTEIKIIGGHKGFEPLTSHLDDEYSILS